MLPKINIFLLSTIAPPTHTHNTNKQGATVRPDRLALPHKKRLQGSFDILGVMVVKQKGAGVTEGGAACRINEPERMGKLMWRDMTLEKLK